MASQVMDTTMGLDDLMSTLMSMGFEFNDCHEAITNGKLTVQAAIDWILAGKPGNVLTPQPSLKLNKSQGSGQLGGDSSNPFIPENLPALTGSSAKEPTTSKVMDVDVGEDTILSRSHLSEKQQQIKLCFEEKERQEARRKVQEEKRKKRQERERILKEIQEDREKVKLTKQSKASPAGTSQMQASLSASQADMSQPAASSQLPSASAETLNGTTSIQVRLPSGQMFRQTFPVNVTLNNVWDAVYNKIRTAMNAHTGFIQPFPRREFSKEEMGQTLQALGLVPSGSLVLKKRDADQAASESVPLQPAVVMRALEEAERDREEEEENDERMPWRQAPNENRPHHWGRGFGLDQRAEFEAMPMDQDEDDDDDMHVPNAFDQFVGLANHPILGNPPVFEGFGQRLVPEGVPEDNGRHLTRSAAEMAAEAAAQRSAQPQQQVSQSSLRAEASSSDQTHNHHNPPSLQNLSMYALARRLSDPRKPIFSVSGLSESLLQKFLTYLMKEQLLKPKVLHLMPNYLLKLVLDYYPYTTNELLYSAKIFINLNTLSLNSCSLITDAGLNHIKGLKALKSLNLSSCGQITNNCFSCLTEMKRMQFLSLEGTGVTDQGVIQFALSDSCPQIIHLDLSRTSVTHEIFIYLPHFKMLRGLYLKKSKVCTLNGIDDVTSLENLDVSETDIATDSVLCLTRLPNLHQISLTGTQEIHGDQALYYLKDMKLSALHLPCRASVSDIGLAYIAGFNLTALDLTNYTNVGDQGMISVGKIVSLKKLLLSNTKITDEGMQHLSGLVNLEVLFLDRTLISNPGVSIVANFKMLNELSLSATSVTSDFLKQGYLNACDNLTKLNISRTIIGDKGIICLKLANLQLLNLDCTRVHPHSISVIEKNCPNLKNVTLSNLSALEEDEEN